MASAALLPSTTFYPNPHPAMEYEFYGVTWEFASLALIGVILYGDYLLSSQESVLPLNGMFFLTAARSLHYFGSSALMAKFFVWKVYICTLTLVSASGICATILCIIWSADSEARIPAYVVVCLAFNHTLCLVEFGCNQLLREYRSHATVYTALERAISHDAISDRPSFKLNGRGSGTSCVGNSSPTPVVLSLSLKKTVMSLKQPVCHGPSRRS
ncbi:hypothetical protein B0H14DRAFT_763785 [Mycena olivaceomarginata]|nr:hypothetical protein B0H14DRAFT_763785 [Mycena olivaceomarginata]